MAPRVGDRWNERERLDATDHLRMIDNDLDRLELWRDQMMDLIAAGQKRAAEEREKDRALAIEIRDEDRKTNDERFSMQNKLLVGVLSGVCVACILLAINVLVVGHHP